MEYVIFSAIIISYLCISHDINKLKKKLDIKYTKKKKINLNEFVGKNVVVHLYDEYEPQLKGILLSFDNKWFEIRVNGKYNYYKRIEEITSITLKD